jgi:hypothetical protein
MSFRQAGGVGLLASGVCCWILAKRSSQLQLATPPAPSRLAGLLSTTREIESTSGRPT